VLVRMRTWLCRAVGDLGVCLGTADIGGRVGGDLRGSLSIGPNRARIGSVQHGGRGKDVKNNYII
jgi:hypothetical protein